MLERTTPEIGYLAQEVFLAFSFVQTVRAGNTLYLSGVAPLKGDLEQLETVGEGDMRAQVEWVLEVVRRTLAHHGLGFRNVVSETVYATDIDELSKTADLFAKHHGDTPPTSTWVQVSRLLHPKQLVEITCVAAFD